MNLLTFQGMYFKEGYLSMPEDELPVFVEGEFEGRVRAFLKEHGPSLRLRCSI